MEIVLNDHQYQFITSQAPHTGLIGGYGSGKTFAGVLKTTIKHLDSEKNVAYYLPTYPLIRDIAFPTFSEMLENMGIKYTLNRSDKEFKTPYGSIILRSMENPDLIVGYEVAYSLIDEADVLPIDKMKRVYQKVLGRNRANKDINQVDFVSTPEGFGFLYDFFVTNKSERRVIIKGKTRDNKHLPSDYIANLRASYTEKELEAYLNGEFVNLAGNTVYYQFDREYHHTDRKIKRGDILHIGLDFNIDNMAAVVCVIDNSKAYVVDEITNHKNTTSMIDELKYRYKGYGLMIYPDASGDNRKTLGVSDIQELKNSGFKVNYSNSNPFIRDRVNAINRLLKDGKGNTSLFINTLKAPTLTQAMEQQIYDKGVPDKKSGHDHVNDALGYVIFKIHKYLK